MEPAARPRLLPRDYYLRNFETLLATVEGRYGDLLSVEEKSFLSNFRALSGDARRLYVRLLTRRGPWFRPSAMRYAEIEVGGALAGLAERGFGEWCGAAPDTGVTLEERLALTRTAELESLAGVFFGEEQRREFTAFRASRKPERITALAALARDLARESEISAAVPLFGLRHLETVRTFRLLFFGNLWQDLAEFVLRDLGIQRYEPVPLDPRQRLFPSREVLEQHLHLRALRDQVAAWLGDQEKREKREKANDEDPESAHHPLAAARAVAEGIWHRSAKRLADQILHGVGLHLERRGRLEDAVALYAAAEAPPARERLARIHDRLGDDPAVEALLAGMSTEPRDESERIFAERWGSRWRARQRGERPPARRGFGVPMIELTLPRPETSVEQAALEALIANGHQGCFAENWLWRSLFGLAFWDILYAPVPGAFQNPFQTAPLDLHDGFRAARAEPVENRLADLRNTPRPGEPLLELWRRKKPTANALVTFADWCEPGLQLACAALTGREMAAVFDRLSRDLRRYECGFPDLFLIDPEGRVLLAEVKGPGDTLRPEQRGWLEYFEEVGLRCAVVQVRWRS